MTGIIWLASYPKSGNTWLRAFLANYLENGDQPVMINALPRYVFGDNNLLHYRDLTGRPPDSFQDEEIAEFRPKVHAALAASRPHDVFVKTHNAVMRVDGCPLITPSATAGAIYVVRNPLDLAVSFAHHYEMTIDKAVKALCNETFLLLPEADHLTQYLGSWSGHALSWLRAPGLTLHRVRFEDMAAAPHETFGTLVRFLGLPFDEARLGRAIAFSDFDVLAGQERSGGFVEQRVAGQRFFREGKTGVWREVLSDRHVETLIAHHGDVMRELGYLAADGEALT